MPYRSKNSLDIDYFNNLLFDNKYNLQPTYRPILLLTKQYFCCILHVRRPRLTDSTICKFYLHTNNVYNRKKKQNIQM